ncbi:class I SAM-dependent methyltransferase [Paenibacillus sp. B01]|uniref:class I SAM-dependent methyltransferase n=1 Tax=Paenibacillus sp. B01 TaxID=2660554 RepID=UPI00129B523F|nr:class I SAM-dependent methyltransferase [Paenibacillus sp. B01]QGG58088.1 methyltransferase domain-containing protein [Paenibacillus sp. B01]
MDYAYWNEYYKNSSSPDKPSPFALDVLPFLEEQKSLIELGCGNGRDSLFFSKNNIRVVAVDQADVAISHLQTYANEFLTAVRDDFICSKELRENHFDYVYSRFTLHSISEPEENALLNNVYATLKIGGKLFIEARSVKDSLFGLGTLHDRNTYRFNDHSRRFIVLEELTEKLIDTGFTIDHVVESNNLAVYKEDDPVVIRVIAIKK